MHYDWLLKVTRLVLTNKTALLQGLYLWHWLIGFLPKNPLSNRLILILLSLLKLSQTQPLLVYFRPFHNAMTIIRHNLTSYNLKKRGWSAWDSNPGPNERMVGAYKSTQLWWPQFKRSFIHDLLFNVFQHGILLKLLTLNFTLQTILGSFFL